MKIAAIVTIIWITGWWLTWPTLLADRLMTSYEGDEYYSQYCGLKFRYKLAEMMFIATFPPVWLMAPFVTGFYAHGFVVWCHE